MYIERTYVYYEGTTQVAGPGKFLILMQDKDAPINAKPEIRALVRKVKMKQCGHWMMSTNRILGHEFVLSGSYGSDGLLLQVPVEVFNIGVPLPDELYEAWNNGGGHNSAGSEATLMRIWAHENIKQLQRRKPCRPNLIKTASARPAVR